MEVNMAVVIDQETCIGCGVCESIYPDLFEMAADGKAIVKNLSSYDTALAQDAASQCPVNCINIG
jgi:ferredoxin